MSPFGRALARADASQLRIFGEWMTFHDPNGTIPDCDLLVVFVERDVPEPPENLRASKGQYSTAWTLRSLLPVTDPSGYQFVVTTAESYWIREATDDGVGGLTMKLHKLR